MWTCILEIGTRAKSYLGTLSSAIRTRAHSHGMPNDKPHLVYLPNTRHSLPCIALVPWLMQQNYHQHPGSTNNIPSCLSKKIHENLRRARRVKRRGSYLRTFTMSVAITLVLDTRNERAFTNSTSEGILQSENQKRHDVPKKFKRKRFPVTSLGGIYFSITI